MNTKVIIQDKSALSTLKPDIVCAYLLAHQWHEVEQLGNKAVVYESFDQKREVLVPLRSNLADYALRMYEVIDTLSMVEGVTQLDIYNNLSFYNNDIISIRAPQGDINGTIELIHGANLFKEAEKLIYGAACFIGRDRSHVNEYIKSVRLGQTRQGSYILQLLSPLRHFSNDLLEEIPFGRKAVKQLNHSLFSLNCALQKAQLKDDINVFEEFIDQGVNAKLCESVSELITHGEGTELNIAWSNIVQNNEQTSKHIFIKENLEILKEGINVLRHKEPRYNEQLYGHVVQLGRAPEEYNGQATLQLIIDNKPKKIKIKFEQHEFDNIVIEAFKERRLISIMGDLHFKSSRSIELQNIRNLKIIPDD